MIDGNPPQIDPDQLEERIAAYSRNVRARDASEAARLLADDFAVVFVYPDARIVSREKWLEMIPDFHSKQQDIEHQVMRSRGDVAVVYRRIFMCSEVRGVQRNGIFASSDTWVRDPQRGWLLWQRLSTPIEADALPD